MWITSGKTRGQSLTPPSDLLFGAKRSMIGSTKLRKGSVIFRALSTVSSFGYGIFASRILTNRFSFAMMISKMHFGSSNTIRLLFPSTLSRVMANCVSVLAKHSAGITHRRILTLLQKDVHSTLVTAGCTTIFAVNDLHERPSRIFKWNLFQKENFLKRTKIL